jgi:hypothetical protein
MMGPIIRRSGGTITRMGGGVKRWHKKIKEVTKKPIAGW